MGGVLTRPAARSLIVAPRMPNPGTGHPFQGDGDIVLDCGVPGCGWHAMGPRSLMGKARVEHYRQFHASQGAEGLTWINNPTIRAK